MHLASLQAGRALAIAAVLLFHADAYVPSGGGVFARGYLGVDVFFVISGFIIHHTNLDAQPSAQWAARYSWSRLTRVFVPYLPVGIALAAAYMMLPGLSDSDREWGWLPTLTLLPFETEPALLVAWTLQQEVLFYIIFGIGFALGRPVAVVALWAGASVAWNLLFAPNMFLTIFSVEFLLGVLTSVAVHGKLLRKPLYLAAALFMLYLALGAQQDHRLIFAACIAAALVWIVRLDLRGRLPVPQALKRMGDASYAIYLVHLPVMALTFRMAPFWLLLVVAGLAAGWAYHMLVERPALGLARARRPGRVILKPEAPPART